MTPRSTGLHRDLVLLKRRGWLFIPFFILGVVISLAFDNVAGQSNAVATMQLSTVVHDFVAGGDRGFRVFEAQALVYDDRFRQEVIDATGDKNFDYSRYVISLTAVSTADGISDGTLTVSIKDETLANAQKYRQAFVDVFLKEYKNPDGLFRTRFIQKKQDEADTAEKYYQEGLAKLKAMPQAKGLPLDQVAAWDRASALVDELGKQEADLIVQLAQVQGAADAANATPASAAALASAILHQQVSAADAIPTLNAMVTSLKAAIVAIRQQRLAVSDVGLDADLLRQLDDVRGLDNTRREATGRAQNVRTVAASAENTVETTYSQSGGLGGSNKGRVAIVLAVTIVFGLIAIYGAEWLSQVRRGSEE